MVNQYNIVIAAVDKATAVVAKINASVGRLSAPIKQVQSAVGAFSKEAGLDRVADGLRGVSRAAVDVGDKVAGIVAPMAAVAGVSSVTAITAMTIEWAKLGAEVGRTSESLGQSVQQIQTMRGAAQIMGVSTDGLTAGMKTLGDTIQDATYGRNQGALVMMNRLGVEVKRTADGTIDTAAAFGDLAEAISKTKSPQVQGLIARTFGLEQALPLLRKGREGVAELQRQVEASGAVMGPAAIAAATQMQQSMARLDLSVDGLRNSIATQLFPVVQPMVDQLSGWISANKDLIATNVTSFVDGIAAAVKEIDWPGVVNGAKSLLAQTQSVVNGLGGWENAAIAVAVVMNAGLVTSVLKLGGTLAKLTIEAIPVAIKAVGLLAAASEATLIPALAGGALKIGVVIESMASLVAGVPVLGTALSAASAGFVGLGAAIEATPIGWIITGVAAVAGAVYAIYRNWDGVVAYFEQKWAGVKAAFDKNWGSGVVRALIEFNPTAIVADAINGLVEWLTGINLYDTGAKMMQGLVDGVKSIVPQLPRPIANAVRSVGGAARSAVSGVVGAVKSYAGIGDPVGIRQNNPGNLRNWGDNPKANGFVQFPTAAAGVSAMAGNLKAYGKHGWNSLQDIVNHWAPASDNNNVGAYVAALSKQTGFGATDRLDLSDPKTLKSIIPAIIQHENGKNPYDAALISQAVDSRLGIARDSGQDAPTPYTVQRDQGQAAQASAAPGQPAEAVIKVELANAPSGTRVTTEATGMREPETRVSYALPAMG